MILFLAFRNITRNKKNSAIIALLISVICFIFFIGNSVIEKSNLGLHQAFISSITGDVVLQKKTDISMNLFGANTPVIDPFFVIPSFPAYDAVMEIVRAQEGIKGITSQVSGKAFLDIFDTREPVLLCGVDAGSYFSIFSGIILEEGRFLNNNEYGALITADRAQKIEQKSGRYPQTGEPLLFTSGSALGFKIREVPLVGIFSYKNPGLFMNEIIIIDPQTVRALNSIQVATSSEIELSDEAEFLLTADIDDIFNFDSDGYQSYNEEEFSEDYLQIKLAETAGNNYDDLTGGDWNFIIIDLENDSDAGAFIKSLNKKIEPYGVVAVDWRTSVGVFAILLLLIQVLFNAGMFLVCIAGVIAVINMLLIFVFRRAREIGTLRAMGASDIFISSLVLLENLVISFFSGIAGILAGSLFIIWINSLSINIQNELIASLLGGSVLNLNLIPHTALISFLLAVLLGAVVSVYPISVTLKIEPVEAVRQG